MLPQISEFSYGFALTNELVGLTALRAAPLFPSLIEEGRAGGGYDVRLDHPAVPIFIQFKRSECMIGEKSKEYLLTSNLRGALTLPYFRFSVTPPGVSEQHEMLISLDDGVNLVFYAAPRFHRIIDINDAWSTSTIIPRSIFVSPRSIGSLDSDPHKVAFDRNNTWLCSEPKSIEALDGRGLTDAAKSALEVEKRPLRDRLREIVDGLQQAEATGQERALSRRRVGRNPAAARPEPRSRSLAAEASPPTIRGPISLSEEHQLLRQAADIAARVFDLQMVIVQQPG